MTRRRLYYVGRGGSSWRDPRNWSRSPDGPSLLRLHARGNETVVVGDVAGCGHLDLRGMPHAVIEVSGYQGTLTVPDGGRVEFGRRSLLARIRARVILRDRFRPRIARSIDGAIARAGGWQKAVRDGLATLIFTPRGWVVVPRMAGGAIALVSAGVGVSSTTTAAPAFGQATTAGNTLFAFVTAIRGTTLTAITCSDGTWTRDVQFIVGATAVAIFRKSKCGAGETAPTFTTTGSGTNTFISASLAEFSGVAPAPTLDQTGTGTTSPVTAAAADSVASELVFNVDLFIGTAATNTGNDSLNNGASWASLASNNSTSTANHYRQGYGITTSKGSADSVTITDPNFAFAAGVIASYKIALAGTRDTTLLQSVKTPLTASRRNQLRSARQQPVSRSGANNEFDYGGPDTLRFPLIGPAPPTIIRALPSQRMQTLAIYDTAALLAPPLRQKRNLMLGHRTQIVIQSGAANEYDNAKPISFRSPLIGPWAPAIINPLPSQGQQTLRIYDQAAPLARQERPRKTMSFLAPPTVLASTPVLEPITVALVHTRPRPTRRTLRPLIFYPATSTIAVNVVRARPRPTTRFVAPPATLQPYSVTLLEDTIRVALVRTRPRPTTKRYVAPAVSYPQAGSGFKHLTKTRPRPTRYFVAPPATLEPEPVALAERTVRVTLARIRPRPTKRILTAISYPSAGTGFRHLVTTRPRPTTRFIAPPTTLRTFGPPVEVEIAVQTPIDDRVHRRTHSFATHPVTYPATSSITVAIVRTRPRPTVHRLSAIPGKPPPPVGVGFSHLVRTRPRPTIAGVRAPATLQPYAVTVAEDTIRTRLVATRPRPTTKFLRPPAVVAHVVFPGARVILVRTRPRHTVGTKVSPAIFRPATSTISVFLVRTRPRPTVRFVAPPSTLLPRLTVVSVTDGSVVATSVAAGVAVTVGTTDGEIVKTSVTDGSIQP